MGMFTKKYNETEMLNMLSKLLIEPDEYIEAPVYCMFKGTGFLESGYFITGYAAFTNKDRFIGYQISVLNEAPILISMEHLRKIKISRSLFGQKSVYLEFKADKTYKIKFQFSPKVIGVAFPNQKKNFEIMLEILKAKQDMLNLEM